ncbi:unnamed protein product (macronuclear) [Paramecium tetraurelia]|uniref:Cyclic nucleotide-binding domain-containing protein n=1 Tax=Paramecium tetraurelia TaxID=5888 RepID=A0EEV9_PARTE|nr:uncharacterized protein GSPATT00026173001 [Paramecium tetraurelia]CAK93850.1 unnamed protein product [Paramecium tetraurelia]|eukprot:XP_001461223.1 hypothetical protein (macronuclear) [Paramecium tetraurelia strain d4-2]
MFISLEQPLLTKKQPETRRISKNVQMQTFNYTQQDENVQQLEDVPITTKKFLRYTNGIEAYLNTFPSFNPDHWAIFSWRLFICFIVIIYFYLIPVFMFFGYEIISDNLRIENIAVFLYIMMFFLIFDIFITLNTGYYDKGQMVLDKHSIFVRYVTQEFLFDIIAIVSLILQVSFRDHYAFLIWVPYFFYFKYYYVTLVDSQVEQLLQVQRKLRAFYQILKLILTIFFLVNLFACLFYAAGDYWVNQRQDYGSWLISSGLQNDIYSLPIAVKYEYSFYWALTTMLTVGYGDVTGKNPLEIFVSIITMIFACVIFAMIVSAFQNVFSEITHHNMQFDKKMTDINRFMKDKNIDMETQQKVRRFFSFMFSEKVRDFNEQISIINQLGPQLKDEVIMQSYGLIFKRTFWTSQFSLDFQKKIAYLISEQMYCDGEMVFKQNLCSLNGNNDDDCLYCVSIGHIQLYLQFEDQDMVFYEAEQDSMFGELGFLTGNSRSLSAKSTTISQLYKLNRLEFIQLLQQFPLDFQYFCQLRDQILFGQYNLINLSCFCCQSSSHLANDCPKSHYYPNKIFLISRIMNNQQERQPFKRNNVRQDNLNLRKIQKAQQQMKQELSIAYDQEEIDQLSKSFSVDFMHDTQSQISEQDINHEFDIVNEIVNRLEQKKKQALIEIDTKCSYKNYYPKYNAEYIIQHFKKDRRFTRTFTRFI